MANLVNGSALALMRTNGAGNATEWGLPGQVAFPAVQNASVDANTLDDYEEGTWTPAIGGTATYGAREGYYTKIGRVVYWSTYLPITLLGSGSTTTISGLPFTASATGGGAAAVSFWVSLATAVVTLHAQVPSSTATITFPTAVAATANSGTAAVFGNGAQVQAAGFYGV